MGTNAPVTLREERIRRRMSMETVAAGAGISEGHLSRLERGELVRAPARTLAAVLSVLGVTEPIPDRPARPTYTAVTVNVALAIVAAELAGTTSAA